MSVSQLTSLEITLKKLPIIKKELEKLRRDLSPSLTYHSVLHSEDVLHECLLFGLHDNLPERELHLLAVAATFHDSGFLVKPQANEKLGADFAAMAMEDSKQYSNEEIKLVSQMICDTEIIMGESGPVFKSSTRLSGYLLDADLSNFGRKDFFDKAVLFAQETKQTVEDLRPSLIIFLKNHKWHTKAAAALRQEQKAANLAILSQGTGV